MTFVGDIVEANGKTWKENNLELKHNIPIGALVEINWDGGEYNGICLFVVEHARDCDGSPLYGLSFDKDAFTDAQECERNIKNMKEHVSDYELPMRIEHHNRERAVARILNGMSEECLTVISEVPHGE